MALRSVLMVAIVLSAVMASVESATKPKPKPPQLESLEEVLERMMRETKAEEKKDLKQEEEEEEEEEEFRERQEEAKKKKEEEEEKKRKEEEEEKKRKEEEEEKKRKEEEEEKRKEEEEEKRKEEEEEEKTKEEEEESNEEEEAPPTPQSRMRSFQTPKEPETTKTTEVPLEETTTIQYSTSPRSLGHNIYTKPGSPDKKCYCEEVTDDEWTSTGPAGGRGSQEKGSGRSGQGGAGSASRKAKGDNEGGGSQPSHGSSEKTGSEENKLSHGSSENKGANTSDEDDDCFPKLKNIAVHEGARDIPMTVKARPCNVAWTVFATSDELDGYPITGSDCSGDPTLTELYHASPNGLLIRKSTTSENGQPISTSGLYKAVCNSNAKQYGAKLVVVRSGPDCSCTTDSSSSRIKLTCSVDFADSNIHPIPAIMTWMVNGQYYAMDTPYKDKMDMYVYTAISTIDIDDSDVNDYKCTLTFGEPMDPQYDFIATNAPEFSRSCSTPCEETQEK